MSENQKDAPKPTKNPENDEKPEETKNRKLNKGPPTFPPNFTKRPKATITGITSAWSKTRKINLNPFGTPFNPADPFAPKPPKPTPNPTDAFNKYANSTSIAPTFAPTVDLTKFDQVKSSHPFKKAQKKRKMDKMAKKVKWDMESSDKVEQEKWESIWRMKAPTGKRPPIRVFGGTVSRKTELRIQRKYCPEQFGLDHNGNKIKENLENKTRDELIEKVLYLGTENEALQQILDESTTEEPKQEELTNRKLKIKNKHVSTTIEEMNTAIAIMSSAFTDINTHLANFGLGHIDTSATYKRKSAGRGHAVLNMPNGGSFQLDGQLSRNNSYNPKNFSKIRKSKNPKNPTKTPKPTNTDAETQTTKNTADATNNANMSDEDNEDAQSQKPIPDDFKD